MVAHASACAKSDRIFSTQRKYKTVCLETSEPAFGGAQAKACATNGVLGNFCPKRPTDNQPFTHSLIQH
jgi:hypothetical protein